MSLKSWGCVDQQEGWATSGTKLDLPPRVRWLKMLLWGEGWRRTWECLNQLCLTRNETELIHHWRNLILSTRPMQMRFYSQGPVVLPIKAEKQVGWFLLTLKKAAKCSCVNITRLGRYLAADLLDVALRSPRFLAYPHSGVKARC